MYGLRRGNYHSGRPPALKLRVAVSSARADALVVAAHRPTLRGHGRQARCDADASPLAPPQVPRTGGRPAVDISARLSGGLVRRRGEREAGRETLSRSTAAARTGSRWPNLRRSRRAWRGCISPARPARSRAANSRSKSSDGKKDAGRAAVTSAACPRHPLLAFSAADAGIASTLTLSGRWAFARDAASDQHLCRCRATMAIWRRSTLPEARPGPHTARPRRGQHR